MSARVLSVNVGRLRRGPFTRAPHGMTAIDKRSVDGAVRLEAPGAGLSGVAGDEIGAVTFHGGPDQAVYAVSRAELDHWSGELGRELACGQFGENLTVAGIEPSTAVIGERWRVGSAVLEVSGPRIPCRTFAEFLEVNDLIKRFTARAMAGAYLRVVQPGEVAAGSRLEVVSTPSHGVTVEMNFRARTSEPALWVEVLRAGGDLTPETRQRAETHLARRQVE